MTGQMKKYNDYLSQNYEAISLYSLPKTYDMHGLREYSEKTGRKISDLSYEEKARFFISNSQYREKD